METHILESIWTERPLDKAPSTKRKTSLLTQVHGNSLNSTEMVQKNGQTVPFSLAHSKKGKNTGKENSYGRMVADMKANFTTMTYTAKANINGLMEESIRVNGRITKWMGTAFLNSQMEQCIQANMSETKRKALVFFVGQTENNTKVSGTMVSAMDLEQ